MQSKIKKMFRRAAYALCLIGAGWIGVQYLGNKASVTHPTAVTSTTTGSRVMAGFTVDLKGYKDNATGIVDLRMLFFDHGQSVPTFERWSMFESSRVTLGIRGLIDSGKLDITGDKEAFLGIFQEIYQDTSNVWIGGGYVNKNIVYMRALVDTLKKIDPSIRSLLADNMALLELVDKGEDTRALEDTIRRKYGADSSSSADPRSPANHSAPPSLLPLGLPKTESAFTAFFQQYKSAGGAIDYRKIREAAAVELQGITDPNVNGLDILHRHLHALRKLGILQDDPASRTSRTEGDTFVRGFRRSIPEMFRGNPEEYLSNTQRLEESLKGGIESVLSYRLKLGYNNTEPSKTRVASIVKPNSFHNFV